MNRLYSFGKKVVSLFTTPILSFFSGALERIKMGTLIEKIEAFFNLLAALCLLIWLMVGVILVFQPDYLQGLMKPFFPTANPDEILIIIAEFEGESTEQNNVSYEIEEAIRTQLAMHPNFNNFRLEYYPYVISNDQGDAKAIQIGQDYSAAIVIWGRNKYETLTLRLTPNSQRPIGLTSMETHNFPYFLPLSTLFIKSVSSDKTPYMASQVAFITTAYLYNLQNQPNQALTVLDQAIQEAEKIGEKQGLEDVYWLQARIGLANKNYEQANEDFSKSINIGPQRSRAYADRAWLNHVIFKEYIRAIIDYTEYTKVTTKNLDMVYANRAISYLMLGKESDKSSQRVEYYLQAIEDLNEAIKLNPNQPVAYYWLGQMYAEGEIGQYDEAIAAYSRAIALDYEPLNGVYYQRGVAYQKNGDKEEAKADFQQSIEIQKDSNWREQAEERLRELQN